MFNSRPSFDDDGRLENPTDHSSASCVEVIAGLLLLAFIVVVILTAGLELMTVAE